MYISELIERLELLQDHLGDVPVYAWDSNEKDAEPFVIKGINAEGDHIELTY